MQQCARINGGSEAAVHTLQELLAAEETEAALFVDAINTFNNLNRKVALYNVRFLCQAFSKVLILCYRSKISLFVSGKVIFSEEGTAHGDALAMTMFAVVTIPLKNAIQTRNAVQTWFADDAMQVAGC